MINKIIGKIALLWGVSGVVYILGDTINKLLPYVTELSFLSLLWYHWLFAIVFAIFMAYYEGYKGFQKKFSPRVVARALYLEQNVTPIRFLLAPFFCIGYFYGTKKRLITSYSVTSAVALMVVIVRNTPQPWRGMIDVGVVIGLSWGVLAILIFFVVALSGRDFDYTPETPDNP